MRRTLSDLDRHELARELAHARNARDAYRAGSEPREVMARLAALLREQEARRAQRAEPEPEPEHWTAYRHYIGSAYGPERYGIRRDGDRDPVAIVQTQRAAEHAVRLLNRGVPISALTLH